MAKIKDNLIGQTFERLTVIEQSDDYVSPQGSRYTQWLCECSCKEHKKVVVREAYLKSGHTKSCGCLSRELSSERWACNTYGTNLKKENKRDLSGEYGIIWSNNTNEEIWFDLKDADKILKYTWWIGKRGYPVTHINNKNITMHVFLGLKGYDHVDRNRLNNRRNNLRPATATENSRNRGKQSNNTSGFTGVSWYKSRSKWTSSIKLKDKNMFLGYFIDKEDAVRARLNAEYKYFGEFAPQRHLFEQYGITTTQN